MATRRFLHFVFKVGNRTETAKFYKEILGMKFLRHEEFEEGCKASCNGPYDGKWSKSMVGYGPEDNHFVVELTYNYGIGKYHLGNDFRGITVHSTQALENAKKNNYPIVEGNSLQSPDGYSFKIEEIAVDGDPVKRVMLASSNLEKSVDFWSRLAGMTVYEKKDNTAVLGYSDNQVLTGTFAPAPISGKALNGLTSGLQCKLELIDIGEKVNHATAFGRIAFSCPRSELPDLEKKMKEENQTVLTPLVSLDTPGKATVEVVILADPDGHEICFVGDEAFRELSQVDPKADELLETAVAADKSDEWFAKKGLQKGTG